MCARRDRTIKRSHITSAHGELATGDAATTSSPPLTSATNPRPLSLLHTDVLTASPQPRGRENLTPPPRFTHTPLSRRQPNPHLQLVPPPLPHQPLRPVLRRPAHTALSVPSGSLRARHPPLALPHFIHIALVSLHLCPSLASSPSSLFLVPAPSSASPRSTTLPTQFGAVAAAAAAVR